MSIDASLVMENFVSGMGNFLIVAGFFGIVTLVMTSTYIYLVHHNKNSEWD